MNPRITFISILALSLAAPALSAELPDARWIGLRAGQPQKAEVRTQAVSPFGATLSASITGLEVFSVPSAMAGTDREAFTQLSIPGYAYTGEIGKPKLPMVTAVLDAPLGARVEVRVLSADYREVPLGEWGIADRIIPALESVEKVAGASAKFVLDEKTYSANAFYPSMTADVQDNSAEGGLARGHRLVTVRLYPVQYNPAKGTVRYATDIRLRVDFIGGDWDRTRSEVEKNYSQPWEDMIRRMVVNYQAAGYKAPPSLPIYYDIFYGQNFAAAAQALAEWKTKKGFKVRMNMAGGWTAAQVNDSIRLRSPVATYVTIISDPNASGTDIVPASATGSSSGDQTDLYYAETNESGYLPDLYYARISVKTATEANTAVDKLIDYEKADFGAAGTAWLLKACLIAGYDAGYQQVGIATNEYCRQILAREGYTTVDTLILGSSEGKARIVARVNDGRAWTIYTAHGGQTCWCTNPYWYASELNGDLTNQDKHTFAVGHCCLSDDYQYSSDCFGETWPKLQNKGGVSYFGSVPSTYWDEDDWLQRRYFDAIYDSVPGQPGLKMPESGRFTQYGLYWIENHTSTSRKRYYFEAYHVMNDPSMDFWTSEPDQFQVTHLPNVPPNSGTFTVNVKDDDGSTNLQNALVCCWVKNRAGEHWSAYTDASGNAVLPAMASTPGDTMYVTVTRHNYQPYEGYALVVVPASISIVPDHIPVNAATAVTVTVTELDPPYNGIDSIVVTIGGLGVNPALVETTDASGAASFTVHPLYGELLSVTGRKMGEGYDMFRDTIWVTGASSLTSADITVSVPDIGLNGVLTPDYEAVFDASCDPPDFALLAGGCGLDINAGTSGGSLQATGTPTSTGTVWASVAKTGYNVYAESFPCRIVYGTLSGTVTEQGSGTPLGGVSVGGWVSGADTAATPASFQVTTDGSGHYAAPDSLPVGRYDVYATKFGYLNYTDSPMVIYGANVQNFAMDLAPSGTVSGVVTEDSTGAPLGATINVYRTDNGALYATAVSDSAAGGAYSLPGLPYFNYEFRVTAYHHRRVIRAVTVDEPAETEDFVMEVTSGDILVINDHDAKGEGAPALRDEEPAKLSVEELEKIRSPQAETGSKAGESAAMMAGMLAELGYSVTVEASAASNPGAWGGYDLVIWSCGEDQSTLATASYRTDLIAHVNGGGKVLLEGGEVAYDWDTEDPAFASAVMHGNDWDGDNVGALTLQQGAHPLATLPNVLPASLSMAYGNYGDQDACKPCNGGVTVYGTTSYAADGGVIAYDDDGDPSNGQTVYYAFDFTALGDSLTRAQLLENTVEYLLRPSAAPTASLSGTVTLSGQGSHEGAVVCAAFGADVYYDTTDAAGAYSFGPIYDGTYTVRASKYGFTDSTRQVAVAGATAGADFVLYPLNVVYQSDFEADNGGLTGTGDWAWGEPTSGPGSANSGSKLWATNLEGNYSTSSNSTLTLPALAALPEDAKLELWMWMDTELRYDGGNVKLSAGGGAYSVIAPISPEYDTIAATTNAGIAGQWCWSGHTVHQSWHKAEFDLSGYAGQEVQLRLHFGADGSVQYPGWYVDDIKVYAPATGVSGGPSTPLGNPTVFSLGAAYPNPLRGSTTISFGLPKDSKVELGVYNIVGQRVATLAQGVLPAGFHSVKWNGRSDAGQKVSGGVYFYRLSTPDYTGTRRLVMLK